MNFNYKAILRYIGILVVLILVQKTFVYYITLSDFNIAPDLVIILLAYIGVKEGKIHGMVFGFFAGITIDILSGSFLGLSALSYTIASFTAGFLKTDSERFIYKYYFMISVFAASVVSNFIYFGLYFQGTNLNFTIVLLSYVLTSSTYTTLISFAYILIPRKKGIDRSFLSES